MHMLQIRGGERENNRHTKEERQGDRIEGTAGLSKQKERTQPGVRKGRGKAEKA